MKETFDNLYNFIIESEDPKKMHMLGCVLKSMMYKLIDGNPGIAKEFIEKLEAVKWTNYLTAKEADYIVLNMDPKPVWSRNTWDTLIKNYIKSDTPFYNEHALYVTMCMLSSDSGETLKSVVPDAETLFGLIYKLAIDKLKDKDGKFNIRKYFEV